MTSSAKDLVVINATRLIDGNGKEPIENASVVVQGDRIIYIGKSSDLGDKYSHPRETIDINRR